MSVDLKHAFQLSFVTSEAALPIPAVSEILARLRSGPVWDGASIAPADGQFPLFRVEWHEGHGFVIQCYEDEQSWSDFLIDGVSCGPPTIKINLGGQALERWPSELFVPEELAPSPERLFGRVGKDERLGSARLLERITTSNFNWSRRRVGGVRRGSVVALDSQCKISHEVLAC